MNTAFRRQRLGELELLRCAPLVEKGIPHGFTLRWRVGKVDGRRRPFGFPERAQEDRQELARALGLAEVACMMQLHGNRVNEIAAAPERPPRCDGLATRSADLALLVDSADCVPLLFWDESQKAVAAVHAGWRGTLAAVSRQAVILLRETFGSDPDAIHVAMGPAIGACCYEVGEEVVGAFKERFACSEELFFPGSRGTTHLDLTKANCKLLRNAGVPGEQIYVSGLCTGCDNGDFYSYRREGKAVGRLMGAIGIARHSRSRGSGGAG
ncbi:MAG: peptidoglycan editing factor PgeF [Acidobacteriota bacterium]